jgi:hypothetical protein
MGSSTQGTIARRTWVPATTSHRARHLMLPLLEALAPIVPTRYQKLLGEANGSLRASRTGRKRWSGLTGVEILSAHNYRDDGVYLAWIVPGFHSF